LFPIVFIALFTQLLTLIIGQSPPVVMGLSEPQRYEIDYSEGQLYRGFFNVGINLICLMAALFYIVKPKSKSNFPQWYIYLVIITVYLTVFLSATRGWIIGLGIVALLTLVFVQRIRLSRITGFLILAFLFLQMLTVIPLVKKQLNNAVERLTTVETIKKGDITVNDTERRIMVRSPKVMKKWAERPVFGYGFSDEFFKNTDGHVGNQNILMNSGVIGALLMSVFIIYFFIKILILRNRLSIHNIFKRTLWVFPIFFTGWFFIHSTSGQQFAYYALPGSALQIALFFSFAGVCYNEAITCEKNRREILIGK